MFGNTENDRKSIEFQFPDSLGPPEQSLLSRFTSGHKIQQIHVLRRHGEVEDVDVLLDSGFVEGSRDDDDSHFNSGSEKDLKQKQKMCIRLLKDSPEQQSSYTWPPALSHSYHSSHLHNLWCSQTTVFH